MQNGSGSFSRKTPRSQGRKDTNPAIFSIPDRQPKDNLIHPLLTSDDIENDNLDNLYATTESGFRNTRYDLDWRTLQDLAEHSNFHVVHNTFGSDELGMANLLMHQELMYDGLLAGMSFLRAHKYALKVGPTPINS